MATPKKLHYQPLTPHTLLKHSVFKYFDVRDHTSVEQPVTDKTFLNCSCSLVFQIGEKITAASAPGNYDGQNLPVGYALGPNRHVIDIHHTAGHLDTVLVQFNIGSFYELFGIPASEMADQVVGFDDWPVYWRSRLGQLHEQLAESPTADQRRQLIDGLLCAVHRQAELRKRTDRFDKDKLLFGEILRQLKARKGVIRSVHDFAGQFYLTPRMINYLTRRFTGHTLKQLAGNFRMTNLIALLQSRPRRTVDLIRKLSYSNHHHLKRDFYKHTGESLSSFLTREFDVARMFHRDDHVTA